MDSGVISQLETLARAYLMPFGWKPLGAAAVWVIGAVIIGIVRNGSRRLMASRPLDHTLATYLDTSLGVILKLLLLIAVLGVLGVQTTSFAALVAAAALAIGAAWSGLLANFAAGLFLLFLRPFKVGDSIEAGAVTGTLFTTILDNADNVRVSVGNNKLSSFNATGVVLAVRSYCENDHYGQVYFETSRAVSEVIGDAGFGPRPGEMPAALQWGDRAH
jgi:small conductance mechanosensitive channel